MKPRTRSNGRRLRTTLVAAGVGLAALAGGSGAVHATIGEDTSRSTPTTYRWEGDYALGAATVSGAPAHYLSGELELIGYSTGTKTTPVILAEAEIGHGPLPPPPPPPLPHVRTSTAGPEWIDTQRVMFNSLEFTHTYGHVNVKDFDGRFITWRRDANGIEQTASEPVTAVGGRVDPSTGTVTLTVTGQSGSTAALTFHQR